MFMEVLRCTSGLIYFQHLNVQLFQTTQLRQNGFVMGKKHNYVKVNKNIFRVMDNLFF